MGKTSFLGPVYGAKTLLWSVFIPTAEVSSNGATTAAIGINQPGSRSLPNYEDWFVTEAWASASTVSSAANAYQIKLKVEGGSTTGLPPRPWAPGTSGTTNAATILTMPHADTSTTWSTWATAAVSPGEYEGTWCPAGSSLRLVSSGVDKPGNVSVNVYGYIRFANSTRSEG